MRALALFLLLLLPSLARGQAVDDFNRTNLADLIPNFISGGFRLQESPGAPAGSGEFVDDASPQLALLREFTSAFAVQLSSFPLSSSAGGFVYQFDPTLGVFNRASDSFGPVYGERATTVGDGRFNLGVNFSTFTFDSIDGLSLRDGDLHTVLPHLDSNDDGTRLNPWFEGDVITADLFLNLRTAITAFVATYGVTDRFDVGLAVPLVDVAIDATAVAQIQRLATGDDSDIHTFANGDDSTLASTSGDATGLGDIVLRGKLNLSRHERLAVALAADVRAPTGEARDLLGAGEWQTQLQLILSGTQGSVSPHAAIGTTQAQGSIPDQFVLAGGLEWIPHPRLTLSTTFLGRALRDVTVVESRQAPFVYNPVQTGPPAPEAEVLPVFDVREGETLFVRTLAVGLKLNVTGNLLVSANGLIALGESGLKDAFTPLVGVDYSF